MERYSSLTRLGNLLLRNGAEADYLLVIVYTHRHTRPAPRKKAKIPRGTQVIVPEDGTVRRLAISDDHALVVDSGDESKNRTGQRGQFHPPRAAAPKETYTAATSR